MSWTIDKYRIERYENEDGELVEDRDMVERLVFEDLNTAQVYYRNNRITYGSGATYFMLEPVIEERLEIND